MWYLREAFNAACVVAAAAFLISSTPDDSFTPRSVTFSS